MVRVIPESGWGVSPSYGVGSLGIGPTEDRVGWIIGDMDSSPSIIMTTTGTTSRRPTFYNRTTTTTW